MSPLVAFVVATATSMSAVSYLLAIDEKRQRVFSLNRRWTLPKSRLVGWIVVLAPGVVLPATGHLSAFLCWFGAVTTLSWAIASRRPLRDARAAAKT